MALLRHIEKTLELLTIEDLARGLDLKLLILQDLGAKLQAAIVSGDTDFASEVSKDIKLTSIDIAQRVTAWRSRTR